MATTIKMPEFGTTGLTAKEGLRVDFVPDRFVEAIEGKGYRLAWSRGSKCPCAPVNDQTQQPDPNCVLCKGIGWYYFGPPSYKVDENRVGTLTREQNLVIAQTPCAVIKGLMTGLSTTTTPYENKAGGLVTGTTSVTVRPENRLGYYDRMVGIDSKIVYSEILEVKDLTSDIAGKYLIVEINELRSVSKTYGAGDFTLVDGKIRWLVGKAPKIGTRVAVHYHTFPIWIVIDYPKSVRDTFVKKKQLVLDTPSGTPTYLPVQAMVRYDFLV